MKTGALALLAVWTCAGAHGQEAHRLPGGYEFITGLEQATSLRLDPAGLLYIADPGRHVVDVRRPDGTEVFVLGGPGASGSQFDGPMDVDPTTGLLLAVADAGNSRIARFGAQFQLSETIPLYGTSRESLDLTVAVADPDGLGNDRMPGRPIAVALTEANETFAIDEVRGLVAKWDISRRLVDLIGDDADVRLRQPVDLEIIGDQLHVADAGLGSVVVYDLFGSIVTQYGAGRLADLEGLGSWNGNLWVLHGETISVYSAGGGLESSFLVPSAVKGAVDVAVFDRNVYVLTRQTVWRWPVETLRNAQRGLRN